MIQMQVRQATAQDYSAVETLVIESFEPITWMRTLDTKFGVENGLDWRARWKIRVQKAFAGEIILLGEVGGVLAAMSGSTADQQGLLGFIDLLAVSRTHQGHGYGREMLNATLHHLKKLGMRYVHLDCLTDNDKANALYESEGFVEVARHIRWWRKI
jgi:ribosomal protein S18 acetylase RimI-like enzyme